MDSNNDKFKKYMQEESSDVPSNLDWEHMQEGIFEKMEDIRMEEDQKPKRRLGFWLFLLSAILLSVLLIPQTMKQDETAGSNGRNAPQSGIVIPESSNEANDTKENSEKSGNTGIAVKASKQVTTQNPEVEKHEARRALSGQDYNAIKADANAKMARLVDTDKDVLAEAKIGTNREAAQGTSPTDANLLDLREASHIAFDAHRAIEKLPVRNTALLTSKRVYGMTEPDGSNLSYRTSMEALNPYQRRIYFDIGMTFWDPGYGNDAPGRASYESALVSSHIQTSYLHPVKNNFFVMAGLSYQQLESVFDYEMTIDDYPITLYDTIVGVENNLISGEQNVLRGDVELMVQADRRVKHYNKTRLLQLPFGLGKTWHQRRFQTDLLIGAVVNLWSQNQGRTIYKGQVVNYKGQSNAVISNQWSMHAMLGTRLTYHLTENIGLSTGIQLQKSLSNWSNEENATMRPLIFNWHLGSSYHF